VKDVAQDVAEDVLGAAKDGSVRCSSWHAPSSSGGAHAQHTHAAPRSALGRHAKDVLVKNAAQGVAEGAAKDLPQNAARDLVFEAQAARALLTTPPPPPPPPPSLCNSR